MDSFSLNRTLMHSFLNFQHDRKSADSTDHKRIHHNVHRGARSMSLAGRRGLITAPKFSCRKSSVSPLPHKRDDMDSMNVLPMLMHLLEKDNDDDPLRATAFLPTISNVNRSTHTPVIWQRIQRTAPLHVQHYSQNNVGKVLVTLRYYLIKNKLIVDLIQVKDFIEERQSYDIFLSAELLQNCKILEKYETSSKRLTSITYFKKTMEFNVPFALFYSNDVNLLIKACQDTKKADEIGHFVIGPQGNSAGAQHWRRIFNVPNTSFSAWHTLTSTINFVKYGTR